jgi:hypothetical protein
MTRRARSRKAVKEFRIKVPEQQKGLMALREG